MPRLVSRRPWLISLILVTGVGPLATDTYISSLPEVRATLCGKEWTQLDYGWWTLLEPHLTVSSKKETEGVRRQARRNLDDEGNALAARLRQMRGQQ